MANRYAHIQQQPLDVNLAHELLGAIETARNIPHTIVRERRLSYGHCRAMSVGKPWLNYEDFTKDYVQTHKERRRLRVVERWMQGRGHHGVVSLTMQHIFRSVSVQASPQIEELQINDGMFGVKKGVALIEHITDDAHQTELLKLAFLASGKVVGKLLLRTESQSPYTGGCAASCKQAVEDFYLEQPLLEEDYSYSSPDDDSLRHIVADVRDFIDVESRLASLRLELGYGNE